MLVRINTKKGFTLIELAIVLFILGLLLAGLLRPLATSIDLETRNKTEVQLDNIKDTLIGYAIINGMLPCPDCPDDSIGSCNAGTPNDGVEDRVAGACRTDTGNLPWVTLNTERYDAWGRHFTYSATPAFTQDNSPPCNTATLGVSFGLCTPGTIDIYDNYSSSYSGSPTVASKVAAVVISHGKNHFESAQSDHEVENFGRNPVNPVTGNDILSSYNSADYNSNIFIQKDYTQAGGDIIYDDVLIWISPNVLINKMISAGKLP